MGGDGFRRGSVHRVWLGWKERADAANSLPRLRERRIFGRVECQRLVLVGDAHLGRESPRTTEAFLAFLDTVPSLGDGLLITGDLFEFWFTYRRAIPRRGAPIMAALAALRRKVPILMIGGNHDRWGGDFWPELDMEFAAHEARFTLNGRAAGAIHGDGITALDRPARLLHRITAHSATINIFRALHPDLGMWLVDRMSGPLGDRPRPPAAVAANAAGQATWAERKLSQSPELSLLVMGHTHQPATREFSTGQRYVNPGAWCLGHSYGLVDSNKVELRRFT